MTEEDIIAYVDGELGPIEALRAERAIEADPALAAAVARHRALRATVAGHFAPVAQEAPPERLAAMIDHNPTVVAFPQARPRAFGQAGRYAALAATLVAGLVLGQLVPRGAPTGGAVMAQGDLARALDSQLASAGSADASYRIGVSFRARDGRYCRTFEGAQGTGLGCHDPQGWSLARYVAGVGSTGGGDYRQAGSSSADILAAAQDMMAGAPLDAAAERAARARGWRD